jgi:2-dehydropantoate 2-reductase
MSETIKKPRIGIIGTGAIGGFYGLMLARAGYDVHFLLRSEFSAVSQHGLRLDSQVHGVLTLDNVQAYSSAADMPACAGYWSGPRPPAMTVLLRRSFRPRRQTPKY